jgi:hypothetical protein
MTPQEKAEELIDKFHIKVYVSFIENSIPSIVNALMLYNSAKECALIAVDEIIKSNPIAFDEDDNCIAKQWWQEVKTEIEKL